jgi:hypothetical protein
MIGGYDSEAGHAFAEFLIPENEENNRNLKGFDYRNDSSGTWVSLDWFKGQDHKRYLRNVEIYEDI